MSRDRRLGSGARFVVVGLASGITSEDEQYVADHPQDGERFRPVIAADVEASPETTHVMVYEHKDFSGGRTGYRHRIFLRRVAGER